MSWKSLGRKKSKPVLNPSADELHRSITPTPQDPDGRRPARTGILGIRIVSAENLAIPQNVPVPPSVQAVLDSEQARAARAISPSSVTQQRLARRGNNRDSVQRVQCWWLPYLVLEFEYNEVLITPLGGGLSAPVYMYNALFDVSRNSPMSIRCYLRKEQPRRSGSGTENEMGNDIFIGAVKFTPSFDSMSSPDRWYNLDGPAGQGRVKIGISFRLSVGTNVDLDSFELLKVIGKGSFGKVMQVRKRDTTRIYALKTIRKAHIAERNEITHTLAERLVLAKIDSPFIVPLKFSFQSEQKLYLVLAFINGGELFHHLQREHRFSEERSRFYAAELLLALEHLHDLDVIYRAMFQDQTDTAQLTFVPGDLKPENILLDYTGHIALCDFGLCKLNMKDSDKTNTFCGTPEYLAPEVLCGSGYNRTIDFWTLGVILYEMLSGLPPFYDESADKMYQKILHNPLIFPDDMGEDARSVLTGLLSRDPNHRLGVRGATEIKQHPFFEKHLNFVKLLAKDIQPPWKPSVASAVDVSNFDEIFTSEDPLDSVVEGSHLSQTVQAKFAGFSYDGSGMPASPT